ncbi:MAG: hypothetical protein J7M24_08560, partial [Candidatus Latescibacteria bacterium]|nr:hypothetical protein [Candidatus Latescibacterota bacterium]
MQIYDKLAQWQDTRRHGFMVTFVNSALFYMPSTFDPGWRSSVKEFQRTDTAAAVGAEMMGEALPLGAAGKVLGAAEKGIASVAAKSRVATPATFKAMLARKNLADKSLQYFFRNPRAQEAFLGGATAGLESLTWTDDPAERWMWMLAGGALGAVSVNYGHIIIPGATGAAVGAYQAGEEGGFPAILTGAAVGTTAGLAGKKAGPAVLRMLDRKMPAVYDWFRFNIMPVTGEVSEGMRKAARGQKTRAGAHGKLAEEGYKNLEALGAIGIVDDKIKVKNQDALDDIFEWFTGRGRYAGRVNKAGIVGEGAVIQAREGDIVFKKRLKRYIAKTGEKPTTALVERYYEYFKDIKNRIDVTQAGLVKRKILDAATAEQNLSQYIWFQPGRGSTYKEFAETTEAAAGVAAQTTGGKTVTIRPVDSLDTEIRMSEGKYPVVYARFRKGGEWKTVVRPGNRLGANDDVLMELEEAMGKGDIVFSHPSYVGVSDKEREAHLMRSLMTQAENTADLINKKYGGRLRQEAVVIKPRTLEEYRDVGLVIDPVEKSLTTLARNEHIIAVWDMYRGWADNPALARSVVGGIDSKGISTAEKLGLKSEELLDPKNPEHLKMLKRWKKLEGSEYGPLDGMYVRPDLHSQARGFHESLVFAEQMWNEILRGWRVAHTVLSPGTHGRNFFGNLLFAFWDGMLPATNWEYYGKGAQALLGRGKLASDGLPINKYLRELEDADLSFFELEFLNQERTGYVDAFFGEVSEGKNLLASLRGLHDKIASSPLGELYAAEDTLFKMSAYIRNRELRGMSIEDAIKAVRKAYPDYLRVPAFLTKNRWFSWKNAPWGAPFVSFTYEASRIFLSTAQEKPVRFMAGLMFPHFLANYSRSMLGITDEEMMAIQRNGAFWRRSGYVAPLMPMRDAEGRPVVWDMSYTIPLGELLELAPTISAIYNRLVHGEEAERPSVLEEAESGVGLLEQAGGTFGKVSSRAALSNPFLTALAEAITNRSTFTGRELVTAERTATPREWWRQMGNVAWQNMMPSILGTNLASSILGIEMPETETGEPVDRIEGFQAMKLRQAVTGEDIA